ncbi:MAG TPA: hypothetical protein PK265_03265 [Candidatus Saccharibacteria bacterium]|nr:hypothetical protein [Candidatus Saccharibacteria bacterium]HRQ98315.1 hypothetical protein [Candidatus Saccharibacteria bacterium]
MTNRRAHYDAQPVYHLPPPEVLLIKRDPHNLIPTPVDGRGLVDTKGLLIEMAKTVDPSYKWASPFNDVHHLQWPSRWYGDEESDNPTPSEFRELAISKWVLPRVLHNYIHWLTEPPEMPEPEVMHYRIEAQRVVTSLFQSVKVSKHILRSRNLTEKQIDRKLLQRFGSFSNQLEKAKQAIPIELQPVDLTVYKPETVDDMFNIGSMLGKYAVAGSANIAMRLMQQPQRNTTLVMV